jgi:hypothetical protein
MLCKLLIVVNTICWPVLASCAPFRTTAWTWVRCSFRGVEPRQMAPFGQLWQTATRCVAGRSQVVRQIPVGIVIMLSVEWRYYILECHRHSHSFWWSQRYSFWCTDDKLILAVPELAIPSWCIGAGYSFLMRLLPAWYVGFLSWALYNSQPSQAKPKF